MKWPWSRRELKSEPKAVRRTVWFEAMERIPPVPHYTHRGAIYGPWVDAAHTVYITTVSGSPIGTNLIGLIELGAAL